MQTRCSGCPDPSREAVEIRGHVVEPVNPAVDLAQSKQVAQKVGTDIQEFRQSNELLCFPNHDDLPCTVH